ncbi:thiamine phosphate synthase [Chakrabartyella piscis]|uniref:thiamine phosphate synthase n=1 Tax=Chakrabartyella piscis TaxID=2918914 RepID=UPI002958CCBC|nr:thiamine phosphate synthase [Chakrabartyella piscis]
MKLKKGIYFVTDSTNMEETQFLSVVENACKAGLSLLQVREKDRSSRDFLELALKVKEITKQYDVPLIINDRVDVALACDADGVHVGATDFPVDLVRQMIGPDKILGATTKTVEAALAAQEMGADYLGVGAIYPTTTKVVTVLTSTETLANICDTVQIPVYAIGGLNAGNMDVLAGIPIHGMAVVSAIMKAKNPYAATLDLTEKLNAL